MSRPNQVISVAVAAVLIVGLFAGTVVTAGASGGGALTAATQGLGIADQDDTDNPAGVAPSDVNTSYEEAVATARAQLARSGGYTLTGVNVDSDGYEFEFVHRDNSTIGEAEIEIDGETGKIVESEQEYEPRDDDDSTVGIAIVDGTPAPGANVTAELTLDGEPLADAELRLDDDVVGVTDESGTVQVTLPDDSESTLSVEVGDAEGELEFEFEDEREEAEDDEDEEEDEGEDEEDEEENEEEDEGEDEEDEEENEEENEGEEEEDEEDEDEEEDE